jgi:hypothetical protein
VAADADNILDDLIARIAKVRHWLVALGVLKTAAIGLACVCLYIGLYAWLDHHAHFGHLGRLAALLLLIVLLAGLSLFLLRALRRSMTYANAANYVEHRRSFDQQLVAAVEYFEKKREYPYSRALAEQLVLQVDQAARDFRFDSTIEKWRGYVLAALITAALAIVGVFVQQNVLYFSSYLARLFRPLAQIEPVPQTILESVTQDIVTARDAPVTLTAAVRGRTPQAATLVLTARRLNEANDVNAPVERIDVRPTTDSQGNTSLAATKPFGVVGLLTYRFEADRASSDVHTIRVCEPPSIKSIAATISPPQGRNGQSSPEYNGQIKDAALEVLPRSLVTLEVQCTQPLREATAALAGTTPEMQGPDGTDKFSMRFSADKASVIEFKLTSTDGIGNSEPQQLRIVLKGDEPPQFKLLSPEGDCLATDVASIPITFEISDDFGLESAQLSCEFPGRGPVQLDSKVVQGARTATVSHTLELEQYNLQVGDSILFYSRASDIGTGLTPTDANHCSDVYFIEIRPYRQYWHPQPSGGKPNPNPGPVPEDLITILEYTRAILKKTWTLANDPEPMSISAERFQSLCADVEYCAGKLTETRDDPENGFSEADKAALSQVLDRYRAADDRLQRRDAKAALPPARDAYRLLRQFIDELHLKWTPPESGKSVPQAKPERVRLQEEPQPSESDKQRVENQLEKLQRKIESLAREQKSLSSNLKKTLQQNQSEGEGQTGDSPSTGSSSTGSGKPSTAGAQSAQSQAQKQAQKTDRTARPADKSQQARDDNSPGKDGQKQGDDASKAREGDKQASSDKSQAAATASKQADSQGQNQSTPGAGSEGQGKAEAGQPQKKSGPQKPGTTQATKGSSTSGQAGSQGGNEPAGDQGTSPGGTGAARAGQPREVRSTASDQPGAPGSFSATDARLRMLEAKQKALRQEASDVRNELQQLPASEASAQGQARDEAQQSLGQAVEKMKEFEDKLAEARYEPMMQPPEKAGLSESAEAAGRKLTEAGRAIKQGLSAGKPQTAADKVQETAEQLAEDADALDKSLSPEDRRQMLERLEAAKRLLESGIDPQWATVSGGGTPGGSLVYTQGGATTPAETARMLAQRFWSIAIEARQKELRPFAEEPSDVEFFQAEKEFFERAARFRPQGAEK